MYNLLMIWGKPMSPHQPLELGFGVCFCFPHADLWGHRYLKAAHEKQEDLGCLLCIPGEQQTSLRTPQIFYWWLREQRMSSARNWGEEILYNGRITQFELVLRAATSKVTMLGLEGSHKPLQVPSSPLRCEICYLHLSTSLLFLTLQTQGLSCLYWRGVGWISCLSAHFSGRGWQIIVCGWPRQAPPLPITVFSTSALASPPLFEGLSTTSPWLWPPSRAAHPFH